MSDRIDELRAYFIRQDSLYDGGVELLDIAEALRDALATCANELENQLSLDPDMPSAATADADGEAALVQARAVLDKLAVKP